MHPNRFFIVLAALALLLGGAPGVTAQDGGPGLLGAPAAPAALPGTGFTYQGFLADGGGPVDGNCDFEFRLYDALTVGTQVGGLQAVNNVTVTGGRFTVTLNGGGEFGARAFDGSARWLDIAVRCPAGGGAYTPLTPRQPLTPAPLALALPGLRTEYTGLTSPNVIGGHISNTVGVGVVGATIGGGGSSLFTNTVTADFGTVGGGERNRASGTYATVAGGGLNAASGDYTAVAGGLGNTASGSRAAVGGGQNNTANGGYATVGGGQNNGTNAGYATVGGGFGNNAINTYATAGGGYGNDATGLYAIVGGGYENIASAHSAAVGGGFANTASGPAATVGGGENNTASGQHTTVGGGFSNAAGSSYTTASGGLGNTASGPWATVGGGLDNSATFTGTTVGGGEINTANGWYATVAGGVANSASHNYAAVGGGTSNTANGEGATVPGGRSNLASGTYSFAAGRGASALHEGAFVWSSNHAAPISSTVANQFLVRAAGGVSLTTNAAGTVGASLPAGSGAWVNFSDRNAKANFAPVDGVAVLNALAGIPIETWNYHTQDAAIRHMGPMAQDFYAAFGLGETETGISTVDADGVALAAIQGLYTVVKEQQAEIAALKAAQAGTGAPVPAGGYGQLLLGLLLGAGIAGGAFALGRWGRGRGV